MGSGTAVQESGPLYYAHVKPILETNQDKIAAAAEADAQATGYVRGADYYGGN